MNNVTIQYMNNISLICPAWRSEEEEMKQKDLFSSNPSHNYKNLVFLSIYENQHNILNLVEREIFRRHRWKITRTFFLQF